MNPPLVYAAIAAISAKLSKRGIAKNRENSEGEYRYRGIDDIYAGLAPLLAKHQLCLLPRVIERECTQRTSVGGDALFHVSVRVAFDFVAVDDGSTHTIETYGEAVDLSDKATAKAMSAAYKYAAVQTFCIPTGEDDAEKSYQRVRANRAQNDAPVQGWEQWVADICDMARVCETEEALTRLQQTYRHELRQLASADKNRFTLVGARFQERREALASRKRGQSVAHTSAPAKGSSKGSRPTSAGATAKEAEIVVDVSA